MPCCEVGVTRRRLKVLLPRGRADNGQMDAGSSEPDYLEQGGGPRLPVPRLPVPGWRPSRGASVLAAVTLVAGLAIGYAVGQAQDREAAAPRSAASSPSPGSESINSAAPAISFSFSGPTLTEDPGTCSTQVGRNLELGIPITNQSPETIRLDSAKPLVLSVGLLRVLSWRWDPCGLDSDGIVPDTVALGPGETTWLTAIVRPLTACPTASPVQFRVTYSMNRQTTTMRLPGFADLGAVRYSRCPSTAP